MVYRFCSVQCTNTHWGVIMVGKRSNSLGGSDNISIIFFRKNDNRQHELKKDNEQKGFLWLKKLIEVLQASVLFLLSSFLLVICCRRDLQNLDHY